MAHAKPTSTASIFGEPVKNWTLAPELGLRLSRGTVVANGNNGEVVVVWEGDLDRRVVCDVVQTSYLPVLLEPGDTVLILLPDGDESRGVIFGRVGAVQGASSGDVADDEVDEELVIEARKNLTLKCGEGSITIREDGKILIKGKDLVSHAQRMNRIKGGSVSIN